MSATSCAERQSRPSPIRLSEDLTPEQRRWYYVKQKDRLLKWEIPVPQIPDVVTEIVEYERDKNNRGTTRKERKRDLTFYRILMDWLLLDEEAVLSDEAADAIFLYNLEMKHKWNPEEMCDEIRMLEQIKVDRAALKELQKICPDALHAIGIPKPMRFIPDDLIKRRMALRAYLVATKDWKKEQKKAATQNRIRSTRLRIAVY